MEIEFESRPSRPGSLIWSEDNILALVTTGVLHIFVCLTRCSELGACGRRCLAGQIPVVAANWILVDYLGSNT